MNYRIAVVCLALLLVSNGDAFVVPSKLLRLQQQLLLETQTQQQPQQLQTTTTTTQQHTRFATELQVFKRAYNFSKNKLVGGFKINGKEPEPVVNGDEAKEQLVAANHRLGQLESQLRSMEVEYGERVEQVKDSTSSPAFLEAQEQARTARSTVDKLEVELRIKEQQQRGVIKALREEMKRHQEEMKLKANQYGEEFTQMKIDANKEKMEIVQEHKKQGVVLYDQMNELKAKLEKERNIAKQSQDVVDEVKRQMEAKEQELKERASQMATEVTNMKLQAHREKMELVGQVQGLQGEVDFLKSALARAGISPPSMDQQ